MEAIAVTAVIRKAADIAGTLALDQSSRFYWLQEDIGWIHREMSLIQSFLRDADSRRSTSQGLTSLHKIIRDLAYDIEDIMDSSLLQIKKQIQKTSFLSCLDLMSCSCDLVSRYQFSMDIKGIRRRVKEIKTARLTYGITSPADVSNSEQQKVDPRRPFLHVDEPWITGLDSKIKGLTAKLLNPNPQFSAIPIVGPPGVGKTALAKIIIKCSQSQFDCAAFVYVSDKPIIKDVLLDLARQVGLEEAKTEKDLEANIYNLLKDKRYVIAFDDIWFTDTWDSLRNSIPDSNQKGSRLILTTRNSNVGRYAGKTKKTCKLQPLNAKDSRKLFHKLVPQLSSKENTLPPVMRHIADQILWRCGGLPLAILSSARILASRERSEAAWLEILESMDNGRDGCLEILALSYHSLPTDMKPCFLTFGLFPEDYVIASFELINIWLAEKFIRDVGKRRALDVGHEYLHFLFSQNLIQVASRGSDGTIRSCRIHRVLHRLCVKLAKEGNFFQILDDLDSHSCARVRRLAIQYQHIDDYVAIKHRSHKCRALLCFDSGQTLAKEPIKELLGDFKNLRTLILEFQILQSTFPDEIGSLSQLSYLRLTGHADSALPRTIRNLKNLQTLDVRECLYIKLPICIWQMQQLRHLFLKGNIMVSHMFKELGPKIVNFFRPCHMLLPDLHVLDAEDGCNLKPSWLYHLTSIKKLQIRNPSDHIIRVLSGPVPTSRQLENLRLSWRKDHLNERLNLSQYNSLLKLQLGIPMTKLPEPDEFPQNLIKLTLLWTELEEDPMEVLKRLPNLRILKMNRNSYVGRSLHCSGAKGFPQLEFLQLNGLWPLKEVIADEAGLPKLKRVIIEKCSKLKRISERLRLAMQKNKSRD